MALRLTRLLRAPQGLGLEQSITDKATKLVNCCKQFSFRAFFEEKNFWHSKATGPFWLIVFSAPWWYGGLKNAYWTREFRALDRKEILSDRFAWLHEQMLSDEVERALLAKVPAGGFDKKNPQNVLGPDHI
eukprot:GDKI01026617.1.p2 GENE.GDKI01026617.1~~GDKI01026617.1.p2  ORF type:complete len:131 (+),score=38.95 GDKI01026617.1:35-427(+)